jgi:hypothetical protein
MKTFWQLKSFLLVATTLLSGTAYGHGGLLDENGGHGDRSAGEYHCHVPTCVPPATISVVSFNIQFLGNSPTRDDEALAGLMAPHDIVVVQGLVSPPYPGTYPNGDPFKPGPQSAAFFEAMASHGFEFILSPEDTGTGNSIHRNDSSTQWWVAFFKPDAVQAAEDLPWGFLADDRSNNDDYERVPFAFAFRTLDESLDFVLISVLLQPNAGVENAARRAHELASIAEWIDYVADGERDFIILGNMNIQNCAELAQATPSGFESLNDTCAATNTNIAFPGPYDHVMYRAADTTAAEMPRQLEVLNLIALFEAPWFLNHTSPYPGNPYNHDAFRATYSDHHPIVFRLILTEDDD